LSDDLMIQENNADLKNFPMGAINKINELPERKYRTLFEIAPDAIFVADTATGIIIDANNRAAELLGMPLDEIIGMHQTQVHPTEDSELYREIFMDLVNKGAGIYSNDVYLCNNKGQKIPIEISAAVTKLDDQDIIYGIFRDITQKKKLRDELTENEKRYRQLYNNSPIPLYRTRISDGKLLECNQALVELFGYDSKEEFQSNSNVANRYVDINDRTVFLEKLKKYKRITSFQTQNKRKDGEFVWIEATAKIFPEQGFIEGAMQDITASKVLSKTENKILDQLMQGKGNKHIARELNRSVRTIEDHRSHIMHKLGVDNLVDLTQKVLKLPDHHPEK